MTKKNDAATATDATENNPVFNIQRIYIKDASMELPNAPEIFLETGAPEIEISIDLNSAQLQGGFFETSVMATVSAKINQRVAFLVEVKQAGIFEIKNIPDEQMGRILGIACPTIIYPYLRAQVADLISRSGYPPVHLNEVNFELMFRQRIDELAQTAKDQVPGAT